MSQQSVRQAARRSALDAQAVLRKERTDRERRLEAWVVDVLTALGERDGAVRDAEQCAGCALLAMTVDEGLSGADRCRSGVTVREVTRLRRLVHSDSGRVHGERAARQCSGSGRPPCVHESATVELIRCRSFGCRARLSLVDR